MARQIPFRARSFQRQFRRHLRPSAAALPHQCAFWNKHIVEKHLVKIVRPAHVDNRPDGDAGRVHIDQELAEPRVTLTAFFTA